MGPSIIARNYAETLLELARRHGGPGGMDDYGRAIHEVAELLRREPRVRQFLHTPRVGLDEKKAALRSSLEGRVPDLVLRFLLVVLDHRRQALIPEIAASYQDLVDQAANRVRAQVTLPHAPRREMEREIVATLERQLGKTVAATFESEPELIGGVIVRVGDRVLDGSVRRRLIALRRRLLDAPLPEPAAADEVNFIRP